MHTVITYVLAVLHILSIFEMKKIFKSLQSLLKQNKNYSKNQRQNSTLAHKDVVGNKSKAEEKDRKI